MEQLTCPGCNKKSKEFLPTATIGIGARIKETGFRPVSSHTMQFTWICADCYKKIHELALEIHKIVKDEYLFFTALLKE